MVPRQPGLKPDQRARALLLREEDLLDPPGLVAETLPPLLATLGRRKRRRALSVQLLQLWRAYSGETNLSEMDAKTGVN